VHLELAAEIAQFVGKEDAIVFGMGYATNSTTLPALVSADAVVWRHVVTCCVGGQRLPHCVRLEQSRVARRWITHCRCDRTFALPVVYVRCVVLSLNECDRFESSSTTIPRISSACCARFESRVCVCVCVVKV
jgi:hypothetical protein